MRRGLKSLVMSLAMLAAAGVLPVTGNEASACPSCKAANETDARRPRAYMYSILFMLGMPATVFAGFGFSFYRMAKKASAEQLAAIEQSQQSAATTDCN